MLGRLMVLVLTLGGLGSAAAVSSCSHLALQLRTSRRTKQVGRRIVLGAKIVNAHPTRAAGPLTVTLDLPPGLVINPNAGKKDGVPVVSGGDNRTVARWNGLYLEPRKRLRLRLQTRVCAQAASGSFVVLGAVSQVDAGGNVTCSTQAAATVRESLQ